MSPPSVGHLQQCCGDGKKILNLEIILNHYSRIMYAHEKCRRFRSGSGAACDIVFPSFHVDPECSPSATRFRDFSHRPRVRVPNAIGFYLSKKGPSFDSDDDRTIIPYLLKHYTTHYIIIYYYRNTACVK